jgi:hypothetical protein
MWRRNSLTWALAGAAGRLWFLTACSLHRQRERTLAAWRFAAE